MNRSHRWSRRFSKKWFITIILNIYDYDWFTIWKLLNDISRFPNRILKLIFDYIRYLFSICNDIPSFEIFVISICHYLRIELRNAHCASANFDFIERRKRKLIHDWHHTDSQSIALRICVHLHIMWVFGKMWSADDNSDRNLISSTLGTMNTSHHESDNNGTHNQGYKLWPKTYEFFLPATQSMRQIASGTWKPTRKIQHYTKSWEGN